MWISINILQKYYLFTSSLPDKPACTSRSEAGNEEVEDEEVEAEVVEDGEVQVMEVEDEDHGMQIPSAILTSFVEQVFNCCRPGYQIVVDSPLSRVLRAHHIYSHSRFSTFLIFLRLLTPPFSVFFSIDNEMQILSASLESFVWAGL